MGQCAATITVAYSSGSSVTFFFFSSRRRHTRFDCDWSSDVCSSDLVQHPLSSSLVSKAYETGARRAALGTYNFSGDLGKVAVPAAVAFATTIVGWRAAAGGYGVLGLAAALAIVLLLARLATGGAAATPMRAPGYEGNGWGIRDARGFQALSAIGMIDNATRTGLLTFLPFALIAKGSTVAGVGSALALLFAGGAIGKVVCRLLARQGGVIRPGVPPGAATARGLAPGVVGRERVAPAPPALERQQRAGSRKSAPGRGFGVSGAISTKPSAG